MFHDTWIRRLSWLGSVVLVMCSGAMLRAQEVFKAREVLVAEQPSGYWLGLVCDPADAALRSQLKLKDAGLVVREVMPDAPAAKAGLKKHDVIVGVGDKPVSSLKELVEAVDGSEGKKLTLHVVRAGEKTTFKATPAKRPAGAAFRDLPPEVRVWFGRRGMPGPWEPWRFGGVGPGVVTKRVEIRRGSAKLPKGMSVTITKSGEEPAEIVVKQGDKKWEVTEDKLDDLPEDVRKHVSAMLRGGAVFVPGEDIDVEINRRGLFGPGGGRDKRLEGKIEELQKQIQQLQKAIEGLPKTKKE